MPGEVTAGAGTSMGRRVFAVVFDVHSPVAGTGAQVRDRHPANELASVAPKPMAHGRSGQIVRCGQWDLVDLVF